MELLSSHKDYKAKKRFETFWHQHAAGLVQIGTAEEIGPYYSKQSKASKQLRHWSNQYRHHPDNVICSQSFQNVACDF